MATEEYLTFNQTVEKLGITEDELLNLVSGNQLRAFRVDRETKFRLEDVTGLCKQGGASLEAEESAVLELDDLPDDIVLMEEEVPLEPSSTQAEESFAGEEGELLTIDEEGEPAFELVPADEEIALSQDGLSVSEDEEPAFDFGEESLEIVEPVSAAAGAQDNALEMDETILTDSSASADVGELSVDDENFEFSTQEVTIHEDAISEDEVLNDQTDVGATVPLEEEEAVERSSRSGRGQRSQRNQRSHRGRASSAASAVSGRRRIVSSLESSGGKGAGGLIWTGVLALLVLAMIYPSLLMGTLIFYGFTTGRETIDPGSQTWDGVPQNISEVWVPEAFSWVRGEKVRNYFGSATYSVNDVTLDRSVSFPERESMNMLKMELPAAAPAVEGAASGGAATSAGVEGGTSEPPAAPQE